MYIHIGGSQSQRSAEEFGASYLPNADDQSAAGQQLFIPREIPA